MGCGADLLGAGVSGGEEESLAWTNAAADDDDNEDEAVDIVVGRVVRFMRMQMQQQ